MTMHYEAAPETITSDAQYRLAVRTLSQTRRPTRILRLLMNALEAYRQARKMGWSRPQNKLGLTVFQSFALQPHRDRALIDAVFRAARQEFDELSEEENAYLDSLQADSGLMAFVFVHDLEEAGQRYEGITFSLGRRVRDHPRFRDRLDLILDAKVVAGRSRGLSRARLYVDPFRQPIKDFPARELGHEPPVRDAIGSLFQQGQDLYTRWVVDPVRHWSHWTTEYIDYFGPRARPVQGTCFATHVDHIAQVDPSPSSLESGRRTRRPRFGTPSGRNGP